MSACWLVAFPQFVCAELGASVEPARLSRTFDVELQPGGVLLGQVLNGQGGTQARALVTVRRQGQDLGRLQADAAGRFSVRGMPGGLYELATTGGSSFYRVWTEGTAPPSARQAAILTAGPIVRGQDPGLELPNGDQSVMLAPSHTDASLAYEGDSPADGDDDSPSDIPAEDGINGPYQGVVEGDPHLYEVPPGSAGGHYHRHQRGDGPVRWLLRHPVILGTGIGAAIAIPLTLDGDSAS
jgi:hypothetical protein